MDIKKIKIKNYQALNDIDIILVPGLNVITGNSNNGKSAVIRAIRDLVFNSFQNSKIKHGESELNIKLNEEVEAIRNKNTKYIISNKEYEKVGRTSLPEVKELLKLGTFEINKIKIEPNFSFQMDKPFLFDKTPGQKYELIIGTKQDKYLKALKTIKENSNELNKVEKKILLSKIDDLKKEKINLETKYNNLQNVEELYEKINKINKEKEYINSISLKISELENIIDKVKELNVKLSKINSLQLEKINYNDLKNKKEILKNIENYILDLNKKEDISKNIIEKLDKINSLNLEKIDNNILKDKKEIVINILNKFNEFSDIVSKGKNQTLKLKEINEEINNAKLELNNFKKEVKICPICGGEL